ncbi:hypothetical protein JBL43_06235 [Aureibaculum sp. A20]|uniref:Beta-lactamase-inhibitor-like PepSY-like domain-containing protein n=1 Tax=Aureibaculum flavum TaxID=2795986 RepID=A0ABS0WPE8_9FLAO|nr:hypothetical protein [Aureibaculum flavum]MBJ2173829.1 hypothetical protein [Aureibaculum flavum]
MRKLSFLAAVAVMSLVSTTTFAQEEEVIEVVEVVEAAQEESVEIQISELPEAITTTIAADFADYTADKAFKVLKDEKEAYSVILSQEGQTTIKVLFDSEGKVIEQEDAQL